MYNAMLILTTLSNIYTHFSLLLRISHIMIMYITMQKNITPHNNYLIALTIPPPYNCHLPASQSDN